MPDRPDKNSSFPSTHVLAGGGDMGARMRDRDWSQTPLGPVEQWPQSLKTAVRIMLTSRQPMFVWWGNELINLYNDAYTSIVGGKHPEALGQPASVVWREIWEQIGPRAQTAMRENTGTYDEALLLIMERNGYPEETYYTFSYSPIPNDQDGTGGIFCANTDDTQRIIGERQLALLRDLATRTADSRTFNDACTLSVDCLRTNHADLPFAMIYLIDADKQQAVLAGTSGIERGHPAVPERVPLAEPACWPFTAVNDTHEAILVSDLSTLFDGLPSGSWSRPPHQAAVVPIAPSGRTGQAGILVVGLNPFRLFNDTYRGFIELVAAQIAASLANAQAYEEERQRAEALAELDRAKTTFFSNISHEFRTPLTLMLGPMEDLLHQPSGTLAPQDRAQIEVMHRNGSRLLKLVNTLLDFSRIEAGRIQASYEPLELAALTAELASVFRSTIERASLQLIVDCPPLAEPVYVDREMWEKIVFNLISNAFKFTFIGEIEVSLREAGTTVQLAVRDTGTGIPQQELPRLFERFHRVQGAAGRTFEGTGIGLALVQELARLHGGSVQVTSEEGNGSIFTVTIPRGIAHLPADQIGKERRRMSTALQGSTFVEEVERWIPNTGTVTSDVMYSTHSWIPDADEPAPATQGQPERILLADDNADMREYVRRLLSAHYTVEAVSDGQAALASARTNVPDLILTDVMMPRLDGFGLLRELRADARTADVPVILLSARAGEEARVEGVQAGADDYMVKPFAARELLARVAARLELARMRRESIRALREREAEFRQLAASVPQLIWTATPDGALDFINDQWPEYTGVGAAALYDRGWQQLVHPDDLPDAVQIIDDHMRRGDPIELNLRFRHHSGTWRWQLLRGLPFTDAAGVIVKWFGSCTDIHAQEEAARDAQFLAELAACIWQADDADALHAQMVDMIGDYMAVSRCYVAEIDDNADRWYVRYDYHPDVPSISGDYRLSNYPSENMKAMRAGETLIVTDTSTDPRTMTRYDSAYNPLAIRAHLVVPFLHKGRWLASLVVASNQPRQWQPRELSLLKIAAERVWLGVEKLRTEQALRQHEQQLQLLYAQEQTAREQAQAASRLKDEFLATVSHELRTPLTAIIGYSQLINLRHNDQAYVARSIAKVLRSAESQAQLIEDLLDVSRIVVGKLSLDPQPTDMIKVIHAATDAVRPALEAKAIRFDTELDASVGLLIGDENRLQQVAWNLLSNAVKFTPSGGRVLVRWQAVDGYARLSVTDTGQGIAPEFLPFVFDRFRQAESTSNRSFGGLGLGLAIVRHLVEMHGGAVQVMSDGAGQGATFTVSLPLPAAGSAINGAATDRQEGAWGCPPVLAGLRVLIVDDQPDLLEMLHDVLQPCGAVIKTCDTARQALAMLIAWQPDVLISDIAMPGDDGYWLIEQVRTLPAEKGGTIPAVALTAYVRLEDRLRVQAAGFQMYLPKPVDPAELLSVIAGLV